MAHDDNTAMAECEIAIPEANADQEAWLLKSLRRAQEMSELLDSLVSSKADRQVVRRVKKAINHATAIEIIEIMDRQPCFENIQNLPTTSGKFVTPYSIKGE